MDQAQCPGRPPEELDPAAFQRVWRRVMPSPEGRSDCPFVLPAQAPAPVSPPPAPSVPARRAPVLCLGEASAADLPALEGLLRRTVDAFRVYRALARREGGRTLAALTAGKRRLARRLAAAYFLICGKPFTAAPTPAPRGGSPALALRERFQAEQRLQADFLAAAETAGDPCLVELYREGAQEAHAAALTLRGWMEQM